MVSSDTSMRIEEFQFRLILGVCEWEGGSLIRCALSEGPQS